MIKNHPRASRVVPIAEAERERESRMGMANPL